MSDPKKCEECGGPLLIQGASVCPDCCDHEFDPDEGFMCLECGEEGADEVCSRAYDNAKFSRHDPK